MADLPNSIAKPVDDSNVQPLWNRSHRFSVTSFLDIVFNRNDIMNVVVRLQSVSPWWRIIGV